MPYHDKGNAILVLFIWVFFFLSACNKLVEVDGPEGRVTNEQTFSKESTADAAVIATYSMATTTSNILNGAITCFTAGNADELNYLGAGSSIKQFYNNSITTTNQQIDFSFWAVPYQMIANINNCIEGLSKSKTITDVYKRQRLAECKFLRALIYFNLTQLFGEVPLVLTTDLAINLTLGRSKMSEINDTIVADLQEARKYLPETYVSTERVRANKWAATALLARFYLYQHDWVKAYSLSSELIESGAYKLHVGLDSVFLRNSTEAILQLQPVLNGYNCMDAYYFVPSDVASPTYCLTDSLLQAFEPSDKRLKDWVRMKTVNGTNYYYPYKYKIPPNNSAGFRPAEYNTVIRLAEIYLIRAESALALHMTASAIADLDVIRKRAGLPAVLQKTPDISEQELSGAIQKERRLEFFAEWGHRWFDLKRTGEANNVLKYKSDWQPHDTLYPIPLSQIKANPNLKQNPGYTE